MKISELYIHIRILEYGPIYEKAYFWSDMRTLIETITSRDKKKDRNRIILFSRTRALFLVDSSECFGR